MRNKGWQQVPISCPCMFQVRGRMGSAIILTAHIQQGTTPDALLGNGVTAFVSQLIPCKCRTVHLRCSLSPSGLSLAPLFCTCNRFWLLPVFVPVNHACPQLETAAQDLGTSKIWPTWRLLYPFPKMGGVNAMLALFHKSTKCMRR